MSTLEFVGAGAIGVLLYMMVSNNNNRGPNVKRVDNKVEPPPIIRTPVGGYSNWYGYVPGSDPNQNHNKNSIL